MLAVDGIREMLAAGEQHVADIVHPQVRLIDGRPQRRQYRVPRAEETLYSQPLLGVGFLVRRKCWDMLGGYDESPILNGREDTEWWIRVVHAGLKIIVIDAAHYIYRPPAGNGDALSHNLRSMQRERSIRAYIVRKHEAIYKGRIRERLAMLSKGYWWEGVWNYEHGRLLKGGAMMIFSLLMDPSWVRAKGCAAIWLKSFTGSPG
jgi:GT2 family glycosyltransferase